MKENNVETHNQINEDENNKNNIIQNENSQNESNIVANTSNNNNINIINELNNNEIIQNNEININNNNIENNQNIEQIIRNENAIENNEQNIDNNSVDLDDEEIIEEKFNPTFPFAFKLFFIINSLTYYYIYYKSNKIKNFSLCLWPILNKNQYYRIITSHFCYQGFLEYFLSMLGLFYITKYLEREIGSIYLILIAFHGMIFSSILYLSIMWLVKFIFRATTCYFTEQGNFSAVDFCLFLSYFLLKKNISRNINLNSLDLKGIYLVYFIILLIQFLSPSAMFIFNICGTLSAVCIFKIGKNISFPKNNWIIETEKLFRLDNDKNIIKNILGYYSINDNENILNNVKEFDGFGRDLKTNLTPQ